MITVFCNEHHLACYTNFLVRQGSCLVYYQPYHDYRSIAQLYIVNIIIPEFCPRESQLRIWGGNYIENNSKWDEMNRGWSFNLKEQLGKEIFNPPPQSRSQAGWSFRWSSAFVFFTPGLVQLPPSTSSERFVLLQKNQINQINLMYIYSICIV